MSTISERTACPRVLLVEDSRGDAILIERAFKRASISGKVIIAHTAEIGLDILRREQKVSDGDYPDIILLDLNLPYMGGREFLAQVKADPLLRLIPVIVVSSSKAETDLMATYKNYASGFIAKPFVPADYDQAVATIEEYWFKLVQTPATHASTPSLPIDETQLTKIGGARQS